MRTDRFAPFASLAAAALLLGPGCKAKAPAVTGLTLAPASAKATAGATAQFTASATYSDGATRDETHGASWSSSDPAVATPAGNGLFDARKPGAATVTATFAGRSASATLTVNASSLASIAIAPSSPTVAVGGALQLTATGHAPDGTTSDVTATASWSSSDPSVATVDASGLAHGLATGSATLTAAAGGATGSALLTVTPSSTLTSLELTPANPTAVAGSTLQLAALGHFADGSQLDLTAQVGWSSQDTAVATVDGAGLVSALQPGSAAIVAALGSVNANTTFTVTAPVPTLTGLQLSPAGASLATGTTLRLTATGSYSDGSQQDLTAQAAWSTSDPAVATVDAGAVTGLAAGPATVTATMGAASAASQLSVADAHGAGFTLRELGNTLDGVVWTGTELVAVGDLGEVLTSTDGIAWQARPTGVTANLTGIAWSGTLFVATVQSDLYGLVTGDATVLTSPDGVAWTAHHTGYTASLYAVAWSGTQFVAVGTGANGTTPIFTSADGVTWQPRTPASSTYGLRGVAWCGSQFVAAGDQGIIQTSADGAAWVLRPSGTTLSLRGVACSGSAVVVVGGGSQGSGSAIYSSPDGVTFTARSTTVTGTLQAVAWTGSQFVAAGGDDYWLKGTAPIATSPDGVTWTTQAPAAPPTFLKAIAAAGGQLYAVGSAGTVLASADGQSWAVNAGAGMSALGAVASSGAQLVAVGTSLTWPISDPTARASTGGAAWTGAFTGANLRGVAASPTTFVAVGDGGAILTSPDGLAWTSVAAVTSQALEGVAWSGAQFVAVGDSGTILTSPDGTAWTPRISGTTANLYGLDVSGALFVAVGGTPSTGASPPAVLTSPDGAVWTARTTAVSKGTLYAVASSGAGFVAVGGERDTSNGTTLSSLALTSPDGVAWSSAPGTPAGILYGVTWAAGNWVAVGGGFRGDLEGVLGMVLLSFDGQAWSRAGYALGNGVYGLIWTGSQVVAVGDAGLIMTAP